MRYILAFIGMVSLAVGTSNLEYAYEFETDALVTPFIVIGVVCAIIFIGLSIRKELKGEM